MSAREMRRATVLAQVKSKAWTLIQAAERMELSRSLQKFTNVFCEQGLARGGELVKELGKVPAGELPFEGPSCGFPIVLKV